MHSTRSTKRSAIPNDTSPKQSYEVGSVRKAMELLSCFTRDAGSWPLSDLARRLELPKSTAHNLLRTLQSFDLVRQDADSRAYRLGPRAMELGLIFARQNEILAQARPVLRRLAELSGETVKLGILSNEQVLIVAAVESAHQLHTRGDIGTRWPLHSTGMGKAILSALPLPEAIELVARHGLTAYTPHTISSVEQLQREWKRTRTKGFSFDAEESEAGVSCIGIPVGDPLQGTIGAISISGPSVRIRPQQAEQFARQAIAAARAASLSYPLEHS